MLCCRLPWPVLLGVDCISQAFLQAKETRCAKVDYVQRTRSLASVEGSRVWIKRMANGRFEDIPDVNGTGPNLIKFCDFFGPRKK